MNNLPETDYNAVFDAWKASPTPDANAAALSAMSPDIDKAAKMFGGRRDPIMRSRARQLALRALETYEPGRGTLRSHLYNHLRGLQRYAGQQQQGVRVPERLALDRRSIEAAKQDLLDRLGRDPTDDELSDETGFSARRLARIRRASSGLSEGLLSRMPNSFMPAQPGSHNPWLQMVYEDLPAIDQKIFEWSLGWNGQPQLQNQEIAAKLGMTSGAVSQRKALIQRMLDQEQELSPFM